MTKTFEKVKKNILADLKSCRTHTAESWAQIMLKNTSKLTKDADQTEFWSFLTNPDDDEMIPMPKLERATHRPIERPRLVQSKSDEKEVLLENRYHREGFTLYVETKPKTDSSELVLSRVDRDLSESDSDEKIDLQIV